MAKLTHWRAPSVAILSLLGASCAGLSASSISASGATLEWRYRSLSARNGKSLLRVDKEVALLASSPTAEPLSEASCVSELAKAAKICRAEGVQNFLITAFPYFLRGLPYTKPSTDWGLAAKHPLNLNFPGVRVLDAQYGLFLVENFLSKKACQALSAGQDATLERKSTGSNVMAWAARAAQAKLKDSTLGGHLHLGNGECGKHAEELDEKGFNQCHVRNSRQSCPSALGDAGRQATAELESKVDRLLARFPRSHREPAVLTHYTPGGYYDHHLDMRRATVLTYLSDEPEGGGATYFPHLDLRIQPKMGSAAIFFPMDEHNKNVEELRHLSEEQISGNKWVSQMWLHMEPVQDKLFCSD